MVCLPRCKSQIRLTTRSRRSRWDVKRMYWSVHILTVGYIFGTELAGTVHMDTKKEKSKILKTPKTNHKWSIAPRLRRRAEWTRQLFLNTPPAPTPALARTNKTRIRPWNLVGRAKGAAPTTRFAQKQIHAETRPYVVTHIIFSPHDAHLGSSSLHDPADHQRSGPPLSSLLLLMFFLHLAARQPRLSRDHPFSPLFSPSCACAAKQPTTHASCSLWGSVPGIPIG